MYCRLPRRPFWSSGSHKGFYGVAVSKIPGSIHGKVNAENIFFRLENRKNKLRGTGFVFHFRSTSTFDFEVHIVFFEVHVFEW